MKSKFHSLKKPEGLTLLAILFFLGSLFQLLEIPSALAAIGYFQERYPGFASNTIEVPVLYNPALFAIGTVFLISAVLVLTHQGGVLGAFFTVLSVPLNIFMWVSLGGSPIISFLSICTIGLDFLIFCFLGKLWWTLRW